MISLKFSYTGKSQILKENTFIKVVFLFFLSQIIMRAYFYTVSLRKVPSEVNYIEIYEQMTSRGPPAYDNYNGLDLIIRIYFI